MSPVLWMPDGKDDRWTHLRSALLMSNTELRPAACSHTSPTVVSLMQSCYTCQHSVGNYTQRKPDQLLQDSMAEERIMGTESLTHD